MKPSRKAWRPVGSPSPDDAPSLILLFDGRCAICTRAASWLHRRDIRGRLCLVPNQHPGVRLRYELRRSEVDREVWLIDLSTGERYRAAAAINRALLELGGLWPLVGRACSLKPIHWVEAAGYRWVATHRRWFSRWGVTPACEEPGASCSGG